MNEFDPRRVRPRGLGRDVRAHVNWRALLTRVKGWLKPDGRLLHPRLHPQRHALPLRPRDEADWIAQHFFSGGVMPSHGLIAQFPDLFAVEQDWRWNGGHYEKTALHWLRTSTRNPTRSAGAGGGLRRRRHAWHAALAAFLPRHRRPVRPPRRHGMGREPLPDAGGVDRAPDAAQREEFLRSGALQLGP